MDIEPNTHPTPENAAAPRRTTAQLVARWAARSGLACGAMALGEVLWFAMLYPLLPTDAIGWIVAAVAGAIVTTWAVCSLVALIWLQRRKVHRLLAHAIGLVVALQFGLGIFAVAWHWQDPVTRHFGYFMR